jgi:hypothetical protein
VGRLHRQRERLGKHDPRTGSRQRAAPTRHMMMIVVAAR